MAYFGVSTNLVNYLKYRLHEGSKSAANNVTNWEGTGSIAPLVAGYLADAFLGRYWTIVLSMVISAVGYGVLAASASVIRLESAALYAGMYLVALGGVLEPIMAPFGADQFDDGEDDQRGRRQSSFFNWFYLSLNCGSLVGGTVLVWVQTSVGWGVGYGVPAIFSALSVAVFLAGTATYRRDQPPGGSPLTRIAQVVVAAVRKFDVEIPSDSSMLYESDAVDGMPAIHGRRRLLHTGIERTRSQAGILSFLKHSTNVCAHNARILTPINAYMHILFLVMSIFKRLSRHILILTNSLRMSWYQGVRHVPLKKIISRKCEHSRQV
uniref:Uncharacterized protein n=1 Tax=Oryza glaberrima TaxID=4538 RepID=I1NUD7_ORYGL